MKRLHVNLAVADLGASVRFYTTLFGAAPAVRKDDYAKWLLEDPHVNFALTSRGSNKGVDHLGIQVETRDELEEVRARLESAAAPLFEQGSTTCCYAHSEKNWSRDPEGIAWETFLTTGESPTYGRGETAAEDEKSACCERPPGAGPGASCCVPAPGETARHRAV